MCPANHNSKHQHNNQHCINQFNTHTHWTTLNTQIHIHNNQHQTPFLLKITFTILLWIAHPAPLLQTHHSLKCWNASPHCLPASPHTSILSTLSTLFYNYCLFSPLHLFIFHHCYYTHYNNIKPICMNLHNQIHRLSLTLLLLLIQPKPQHAMHANENPKPSYFGTLQNRSCVV